MTKRILFSVVFIYYVFCVRVIQCYDEAPCYTGLPEHCPTKDSPPSPCKCKLFDQSLFCCQLEKIEDLSANIDCLSKESAVSLSNIKGLHIYNMTADIFDTSRLVPADLISLSITNSSIKRILGRFDSTTKITCLNLSNNVFGTEWDDPLAFNKLHQLTMLDFSNINTIKILPKIEIQVPRFGLDVSNNQKMECQALFDLMASVRFSPNRKIHWINFNETFCVDPISFHWFNSTEKISLSQVQIINKLKVDCPKSCNCSWHGYAMVQDTDTLRTVEVDCSNKNLEELPSNLPENTVLLNVTNNNITELGTFIRDPTYQTLKYLYADHNKISNLLPLEASPFISNFLVLSLKFNQVKQLPIYLLENSFVRDFEGNRVYLGGNKFQCKCESISLKAWLNSNRNHILDIEDILCEKFSNEVKLMELDPKLVCFTNPNWTDQIRYVIYVEISLLLLLIGKVSYDYWVFKTAGYLPWPASKMPKLPCDWLFE